VREVHALRTEDNDRGGLGNAVPGVEQTDLGQLVH
jgi:hypothetical protein